MFTDYKIILAILGSILAIYANYGYLHDVIRQKIKPHPYTWLIWSIVSGTVFLGLLQRGGGYASLPVFFAEIFSILIFFFSLKNGFKNIKETDHIFLFLAVLGLIPWYFTKDPTISIVIMVLIDVIAFMPTVIKTWEKPKSEKPLYFELNIIRHIFVLGSISSYNLATTFHSVVMIFANAIIPIEIYLKKLKTKSLKKTRNKKL